MRRLAQGVGAYMRKGGRVVLSGILDEQASGVVAAYRGAGFRLVMRRDLEGWASLLLERV